jgi:hypothetical protein
LIYEDREKYISLQGNEFATLTTLEEENEDEDEKEKEGVY